MVLQQSFSVSPFQSRSIRVGQVSFALAILTCDFFALFKSFFNRDQRYFSGLLSAVLLGFLSFVYLEPMFVPVGLDLAMVALWILSIGAGMVGMCLGVLLPTLLPGICCGVSLSLLVGAFMGVSYAFYLPIAGSLFSLIGIFLSMRYVTHVWVYFVCVSQSLVLSIFYATEGIANVLSRWQLCYK
jgi:hypothetical protein